jgi:hypothetical protein
VVLNFLLVQAIVKTLTLSVPLGCQAALSAWIAKHFARTGSPRFPSTRHWRKPADSSRPHELGVVSDLYYHAVDAVRDLRLSSLSFLMGCVRRNDPVIIHGAHEVPKETPTELPTGCWDRRKERKKQERDAERGRGEFDFDDHEQDTSEVAMDMIPRDQFDEFDNPMISSPGLQRGLVEVFDSEISPRNGRGEVGFGGTMFDDLDGDDT